MHSESNPKAFTLNPSAINSCAPYSCLIDFENSELVATMCALVHFVHHSRMFKYSTSPGGVSADQQARDGANCYVEIAETLIMRLQDALDEDQLGALAGRGDLAQAQAESDARSTRANPGMAY
jgi:hypothetical protein